MSFKKSIFLRLFLTFLLIVAPIFTIGLGIYNWGLKAVSSEMVASMQTQNEYILDTIEKEFARITLLQYRMLNERALNILALSDYLAWSAYDRNMSILDIQDKIISIRNSSRFIDKISVSIPAIKTIVTSNSNSSLNQASIDLMKKYTVMKDKQLVFWKGKLLLIAAYSDIDNDPSDLPEIFIQTEFSQNELCKLLKELSVYEGSNSFIYSDKIGFLLSDFKNDKFCNKIKRLAAGGKDPAKYSRSELLGSTEIVSTTTADKKDYLLVQSTSDKYGLSLVRYIPKNALYRKIGQYRILFWFFIIIAVFIIFVFSISVYRFIHHPLSILAKAFSRVEKGDMSMEIKHMHDDEFRYIYEQFNSMVRNLNSLIDQLYRHKIMIQKAELKQLQSQINPHFLYNSFFILKRRIKLGDNESAMYFARQMGNYFQYVTRSASDEVPLIKEVEHAGIYAEIQGTRFSNRIKVFFEKLPEKYENVIVPRLILQPLIENSFVHSLEDIEEKGILSVRFEERPDLLTIIVEDNGKNLSDAFIHTMDNALKVWDDNREITALFNIHRRLVLKFGGTSGLLLSRGELGGLKVSLNIAIRGGDYVQAVNC